MPQKQHFEGQKSDGSRRRCAMARQEKLDRQGVISDWGLQIADLKLRGLRATGMSVHNGLGSHSANGDKNRMRYGTMASLLFLSVLAFGNASAQSTAFSYQGSLKRDGMVVNGSFDLEFKLFDAVTNGAQSGATVTNAGVIVSNGLFTTLLDFGGVAFSATNRWLEISVRSNSVANPFVTLNPRQPITPAPVALFALAGNQGPAVTNGTTGQNGTTVYGSAGLTVTQTTPFTTIPGLTQTITVPTNSVVFISTDGGMATSSTSATGFSIVDVAIQIDGSFLVNGGFRRIEARNNTTTSSLATWEMSLSTTLTPGNHTFTVVAGGVSGSSSASATVSGDTSSVLQGELTVLVLKK